jgi:hypothetical protein
MHQPDPNRIDRILDIARGAAPAGPGERESRESARVPHVAPVAMVQFRPSGDKTSPVTLTCQEISIGGLGVISPRELAVGCRGAILMLRSNGEPVLLGARVVHTKPAGPRQYESGLEFEIPPAAVAVSLDDFRDARGDLPRLTVARAA